MTKVMKSISQADYVWAANEWWRRYIANPEQFARDFQTVELFKRESRGGKKPSAGQRDYDFMCFLLQGRRKAARAKKK